MFFVGAVAVNALAEVRRATQWIEHPTFQLSVHSTTELIAAHKTDLRCFHS